MIIEIFGILDFVCVILMLLGHYHLASWRFLFLPAIYLGVKGFAFKGDWMSVVDMACAVYFLFLMFGLASGFFTTIFIIWLLYKTLSVWLFR